jgi:hypothetical protein
MERGNSKWSLVKCCHILFSFRRDNLSIAWPRGGEEILRW